MNSSAEGFIIFITKKRENCSSALLFPAPHPPPPPRQWRLPPSVFCPSGLIPLVLPQAPARSQGHLSPCPPCSSYAAPQSPRGFSSSCSTAGVPLFFFFFSCLVFLFSLFTGRIYIYTGCLTAEPFFIVSLGMSEIRRHQAACHSCGGEGPEGGRKQKVKTAAGIMRRCTQGVDWTA